MKLTARAQDRLETTLNSDGRSRGHVLLGIGICLAAVATTTAVAVMTPQPVAPGGKPSRHPVSRAAWPALISVTSLAGLRVWNAPDAPERTRALSLWAAVQGISLLWMVWAPKDRATQVVAAMTTAGFTAGYAHAASYVDRKAAAMIAPTGFAGVSALIAKPVGAA